MILIMHLPGQFLPFEMNGVEFEDVFDDARKDFETRKIIRREAVRTAVDHAQRTHEGSTRMSERVAHVGADMRFSDHTLILAETGVVAGVADDQRLLRIYHMGAERGSERRAVDFHTHTCEESLLGRFDQRNQGDATRELICTMGYDPVERGTDPIGDILKGRCEFSAQGFLARSVFQNASLRELR
ncbi:hypothetical protein Q9K01_09580 [Qipengyuania sp. DY56-A-20]|uniref:Uncharacterized protein n=1 Tax=Qipengyuania benthica TaxID=3067651 RepID=A0ABT9HA33_9SPHN|nr:hypothetical protein [Qipengyuania sp. DY56-A-20]MDP4539874.1 hypothetical protein [Qipengyuania sp. DY56-A-20]